MVTTLRALGMTHLSLGNHEADLKLPKLKRRLAQLQRKSSSSPMSSRPILLNSNVGIVDENSSSAEDWAWMSDDLARYDLVTTPCGRVTVAMMGLLSDDRGERKDTLKIIKEICDGYGKLQLLAPLDQELAGLLEDWEWPQNRWTLELLASLKEFSFEEIPPDVRQAIMALSRVLDDL